MARHPEAFAVTDRPDRPDDRHPDTLMWIAAIEALRAEEGIDGDWQTLSGPVDRGSLVLLRPRPSCRWCSRPLTNAQIRKDGRYCSYRCAGCAGVSARRRAS